MPTVRTDCAVCNCVHGQLSYSSTIPSRLHPERARRWKKKQKKKNVTLWNPLHIRPKAPGESLPPSEVNNTCGHSSLSLFIVITVFTNLIVNAVQERVQDVTDKLAHFKTTGGWQWKKIQKPEISHQVSNVQMPGNKTSHRWRWLKPAVKLDPLSNTMGESRLYVKSEHWSWFLQFLLYSWTFFFFCKLFVQAQR